MGVEKQVTYTNTETGETYTNKKFFSAQFDEEKGYLLWNRKSHNKMYHDIRLPKELSWNDKGRIAELSQHIWRDTNILAYRGNGGIKPYSLDQIGELIGLRNKQLRLFMNKMIKHKVIAKVNLRLGDSDEYHYYVNPLYFFSGKRLNLNLYLLFQSSLNEYLPDWVIAKFIEQKG